MEQTPKTRIPYVIAGDVRRRFEVQSVQGVHVDVVFPVHLPRIAPIVQPYLPQSKHLPERHHEK